MTTTLTIRADCSPTIGTGHVMRMIALGQAWRDLGGTVQFVGETAVLNDRLAAEGFTVIPVPTVHPDKSDLETLLAHTKPNDWIAIDGYHFDTDYQKAVRQAGRRTLVMDDICDRGEYHADILLNQNGDAEEYSYNINPDATLLLGTKYALLRKEFLNINPYPKVIENNKNFLITLGGADPENLTSVVLEALLLTVVEHAHVKIVAGAANPHLDSIRHLVTNAPILCDLLVAVDDMPALMRWTDIALSAAGSTCWELCYFGIPMILVPLADNQQGIAQSLSKQGIAHVICKTGNLQKQIKEVLNTLTPKGLITMSRTAKRLVDGKGATRLVKSIQELS